MLDVLLVKLNYTQVLPVDKEFDLGTAYLAGSLRKSGITVEIIDASLEGLSQEQLLVRLLNSPARVIGISVWLHRLVRDAEELVAAIRSRGVDAHITMGSHSPTFLFEELLSHNPGLDSVICGEGELTLTALVEAIKHKSDWRTIPGVASRGVDGVVFQARAADCELDKLALPELDYAPYVKQQGQFMSVLSSRGCYGRCTFCSTSPFYRLGGGLPWRAHSPARVVMELKLLYDKYGFRSFGFRDDNFIGPGAVGRARAAAIATEIIHARLDISFYIACRVNDVERETFSLLKQAGLTRVFVGVESGSQRRLNGFRKGVTVEDNLMAMRLLTELGIPFTIGYIMFAPDTTWTEFKESSAFLYDALGSEGVSDSVHDMFNPVEVLPGTAVADELKQQGLLLGDYRGYKYRYVDYRIRLLCASLKGLRVVVSPVGKLFDQSRRKKRQRQLVRGED